MGVIGSWRILDLCCCGFLHVMVTLVDFFLGGGGGGRVGGFWRGVLLYPFDLQFLSFGGIFWFLSQASNLNDPLVMLQTVLKCF